VTGMGRIGRGNRYGGGLKGKYGRVLGIGKNRVVKIGKKEGTAVCQNLTHTNRSGGGIVQSSGLPRASNLFYSEKSNDLKNLKSFLRKRNKSTCYSIFRD